MLTISLRNMRTHPGRYISTIIAIVLGVAFFVGTGVLTGTVESSLNNAVGEAFADVDASVRSTDTIEVGPFEIRQQIPAELADDIAKVDGVNAVAATLNGYAQIVGTDGKVLDGQALGTNWTESDINPYELVAGRAPVGPTEIVIDVDSLDASGYQIGDAVRVLPLPADQLFTIVGTSAYVGDTDFGENIVAFDFATAQAIFGTGNVDQIYIDAVAGTSPEQLVANLNAAGLGTDLEAITGDELAKEFQDIIGTVTGFISTALQVFAMIALAVGIFIIYNTFTILVAQRSREMALLRAIGSTGRQVRTAVLIESIVLGIIASLLGSIAGIGLGWVVLELLGAVGLEITGALAIPAGTIGIGIAIGTLITVASAYLPARGASKVPPIAALRDVATGEAPVGRARPYLGAVFALVGIVSVALSLSGSSAALLGVSAISIIIALLVLGPIMAAPLARILGAPIAATRGMVGELAQQNAARSPKRTANTAAALMIGVLLVSAASVFAASLTKSLESQLGQQITADYVVQVDGSAAQSGGGLPPTTVAAVSDVPGVVAVSPIRTAVGEIDGSFGQLSGIDPAQADQVMDLDVLAGSLADLDATTIATDNTDFALGDQVMVRLQQNEVTLTVAALYDASELTGEWVVSTEVIDANATQTLDALLLVRTDGDIATLNALDATVADNPVASVVTKDEYVTDQAGAINILLNLLYGLLGISVLVAVIGIINTMSLSILERTREIGLLRAVGMSRRQIRSSIRFEASIVAIMGTSLGLIVGTFFAFLGVQAIGDALPEFVIPWTTLIVIALLGLLCGIVAGMLPARRAAKLNVLDAIATD